MKQRPWTATTSASSMGESRTLKNLSINPKVSHYHTNGSGRDLYIGVNNGGFTRSLMDKKTGGGSTSNLSILTSS